MNDWRATRLATCADIALIVVAVFLLWSELTSDVPAVIAIAGLLAVAVLVAQLAVGIPHVLRRLRA